MKMGRHPHNALTVAKVRTVKEPGMYADGQGLYLRVDPSGARRWVQRIVVQGKRRNLGLGGWPAVSLAEAREQAIVNLQVIRAGGDPLAVKRREAMPTVAEAAVKVMGKVPKQPPVREWWHGTEDWVPSMSTRQELEHSAR